MGCDGLGELPRKVMGMHVDQHLFSIARDVPFVSCSAETPLTDFQHNPSPIAYDAPSNAIRRSAVRLVKYARIDVPCRPAGAHQLTRLFSRHDPWTSDEAPA